MNVSSVETDLRNSAGSATRKRKNAPNAARRMRSGLLRLLLKIPSIVRAGHETVAEAADCKTVCLTKSM